MSEIFGKKLGQYVLLEQLGEGGMAKVYNALDERVERNVAVKVILPNKRSSQVFLQQFDREAKALANLTHTNIVKVLDYGNADEQPYLVMEFVQGGTLKEAMASVLPWQKAAEILAPIARALDYVHQQNIVHQDIKPSNILLDEEFHPMLSDFGVVKLLEAKEGENAAIGVGVGTPDYMSPEQGTGKEVDFRADIYSLGVVFYEMITGEKPFVADTPMAVVIKHVTEDIRLPKNTQNKIPKFVERAILRAVQKDPEERYASMKEFADVLDLIALGEQAPKNKIFSLTRSHKRKKRTIKTVYFAVPLILALAGFVFFAVGKNLIGPDVPLWAPNYSNQTAITNATPVAGSPGEIVAVITSRPEVTATHNSSTVSLPTPTNTEASSQPRFTEVTLMGTPVSAVGKSSLVEIARWGIGGVNEVEWSPQNDAIALGTTSGIFLYDTQGKELQLKRFIDTGFNVIALAFNPDGSEILAGSRDGQVKAWYSKTGEYIRNYSKSRAAVNSITFSRNMKNIIVGYANGDFVVSDIVDPNTTSLSKSIHPSAYDAVTSADGRFLYVVNGTTTIFVWDIGSRKQVDDLSMKNPAPVNKLAISDDRQFLLGAGDSNSAYLWDLLERRFINSFGNLGGNITDIDFVADASLIAIGLDNGQIKIFARPDIKDYSKTQLPLLTIDATTTKLQSIAFSPSQMLIASGNWDDGLSIWDVKTGNSVHKLNESMLGINKMVFSPDGAWLSTAHKGDTVHIWDVKAGREAYSFAGYLPKGEPFSPDSQFLAVIKKPKNVWELADIQVVELKSGKVVRDLLGYELNSFLQFSDDTKLLVTGTSQKVTIWDVSTWEKVNAHGGINAGCGQFFTPENNRLSVISSVGILFTYSPTDAMMCGTKPKGATFMYYFMKQKRMLFVLGNGQIWTWDFQSKDISSIDPRLTHSSPDDVFLGADQESGLYANVSNNFVLINNINGTTYGSIPGQDDYYYQVAFAPTQGIFALGSTYGSIHIWRLP